MAREVFVSQPRVEPMTPKMETRFLIAGQTGKSQQILYKISFLWVWYDAKWFCGWTYEETDIPSCILHVPSGAGFLHIPGTHPLEISLGDTLEISLEDSVGVKLSFHLFESILKKKKTLSQK